MPETSSFDSILTQCRDLVCDRLTTALSGMLDKVDDAVLALIKETRDPRMQKLYMTTRDKVLTQRDTIQSQFRMRYLHEFQQRSNRVKKIGDSFSDIDLSSLELELVAEDDLDETLKFNAMAAKLRQYCEEELVALDQRVGVLLGDASLQAEDNPFTPQGICDAYKHTCRQIDSNVDVRLVLLKLFDDHVLDDIRAIYKAANALLVEKSILPKIRTHSPSRQEGGKTPSPDSAAQPAESVAGDEKDLFSVLHNLLANRKPVAQAAPAGATGAPMQSVASPPGSQPVAVAAAAGGAVGGTDDMRATLQGADLLRSLTRVQLGDISAVKGANLPLAAIIAEPGTTNVLRELKGTSLVTGMNQMDMMTLDIMSMLFDQLFDDPEIPVGVKGLIGRLQIPMLKVAIADKAFFSKKTHPARQMLDTLGEISARLPTDFNASNPLYPRLEAILQELIDGFEDNIDIFDVVRGRLQTLVTEEEQRVEQETQSAAKQVEQKETLALSKIVAQAEIKVRVRGGNVPRAVVDFLVQEWVKVLIVVEVKSGESSDDWKKALETMDLLIWSVEPKTTTEERRKLAATVPDLLKRVAAGLQMAGVEDAVRSRFFADLRKLHTEVIGKADVANGAAVASIPATSESVPVSQPAPASAPAEEPAAIPPAFVIPTALSTVQPVDTVATAPEAKEEIPSLPPLLDIPPASGTAQSMDTPRPAAKEEFPPLPPSFHTPPLPSKAQPVDTVASAPAPRKELPPVPPLRVNPPAPGDTKAVEAASVKFTPAVTVANPFGDGKVQVDDLDFTTQLGPSAPPGKRETEQSDVIDKLTVGTWVEIRDQGATGPARPAKLSFVSSLKTLYLFVNRQGKTALECSRTELARRLRSGEVKITNEVSEAPLFDRLAGGLVDKLGGPKTSG